MPIYEYRCRKCAHAFEALIRSDRDLPKACPACGAKKPEKALSTFAVSVSGGDTANCDSCVSGGRACPTSASCASGRCPMSGA